MLPTVVVPERVRGARLSLITILAAVMLVAMTGERRATAQQAAPQPAAPAASPAPPVQGVQSVQLGSSAKSHEDAEPAPAPLVSPGQAADAAGGDTAAVHLTRAQQAFGAKDYQQAALELQRAYELDPRPLYLFNVAQAYRRALLPKEALAMYERFLREDPKSSLRGETEGYCNDMRVLIAEQEQKAQVKAALTEEQQRAEERQQALQKEKERGAQTHSALLAERAKAERERKKPIYRRGWFWGVVVSSVALVGAGIGLGVGLAPRDRPTDGGFVDINFALRQAATH